jgi:hypothetical protein
MSAPAAGGSPASNTRGAAAKQQQPAAVALGGAAPAADAGQEHKAADEEQHSPQPHGDRSSDNANADHSRDALANMQEQLRAALQEIERLKQQPSQSLSLEAYGVASPPPRPHQRDLAQSITATRVAALSRTPESVVQSASASRAPRDSNSIAQLLVLQSLGDLPTFSGKGGDVTLAAHEWLRRAENFFAVREDALGIDAAQGDRARVLNAARVLIDDAGRWHSALPQQPSTWKAFGDAFRSRFCSVPSERIRVDKLQEFVDKASRIREKLNVQGMQAFTAQFAQLAGEVPGELLTLRGQLAMLARGLPQRYAEVVLKEESKTPTPPLHEVINTVLSRAAYRAQAAAFGGASSSSGATPAGVDAISLAVLTFGWTREEAARHLEDREGWAAHDTNAGHPQRAPTGPAAFAVPNRIPLAIDQLECIVNAVTARLTAGAGQDSDRTAKPATSRGSGVAREVPADLVASRMGSGLCVKCGIVRYTAGVNGHNAATCTAEADRTTSAAEGLKIADA